jgi:hypothetical protein
MMKTRGWKIQWWKKTMVLKRHEKKLLANRDVQEYDENGRETVRYGRIP